MRTRGQCVRNWRVLTAIAAVVLAVLAGVLVWKYADNAKNDAKNPYQQVEVLVADKKIPVATSFESALKAGLITRTERVDKDLPETRIAGTTDEKLTNSFGKLVAAHDIVAGETLVSEDFVTQGQVQSGLSGGLETDGAKLKRKDLTAVTVTLDDQHAVGGFLSPGDTVN